jgi:membrane fusion protein (multidrug efflux system)
MTKRIDLRVLAAPFVFLFLVSLAGCGDKQAGAAPQAPEVAVITLAARDVSITDELPGRTTAFRVAEVRPQVSGIVQKRLFTEGGEVRAGQQLLQIDPATYRAALGAAEAALKRAEARLVAARLLEERYTPLIAANAVSRQDFDDAVADHAQAKAEVAAAAAQVEAARINLVYTQVLSPISGRIGRAFVTEGALVTAGQSQPLALVQQLDPIYVDISQSSAQMLRLQRQLAEGVLQKDDKNQAEVTLTLEDGRQYSERGKLQFSEVSVDPGTGAVVLRAIFPNPRRELLPGMFVRAQLTQGQRKEALLVPQRGVTRNQRGEATVLVVDAENKVAEKLVTADRVIANEWLITSGLAPGDRVIVDGLQKVRPGAVVRSVEVASASTTTSAPGSSQPAASQASTSTQGSVDSATGPAPETPAPAASATAQSEVARR